MGFSSESLGFSSQTLGFSSQKLGFSSESLGFSSDILSFSSEILAFSEDLSDRVQMGALAPKQKKTQRTVIEKIWVGSEHRKIPRGACTTPNPTHEA